MAFEKVTVATPKPGQSGSGPSKSSLPPATGAKPGETNHAPAPKK